MAASRPREVSVLDAHLDDPERPQTPAEYVEFDLSGGKVSAITRGLTPEVDEEETEKEKEKEKQETPRATDDEVDDLKRHLPEVNLSADLEDDEWQEMEAANEQEVFGEKGEVLVEKKKVENKKAADGPFNSTFGYTRIAAEEQAAMYQQADEKTEFLFKASSSNRKSLMNKTDDLTHDKDGEDDDTYDDIDDDLFADTHSATDQLSTTKNLLTDSEKLAYVGLVKLVMTDMATTLAKWGVTKTAKSGKSKFVKRMHVAQSGMGFWQVKIMNRIYYHLDIEEEEIKMMDKLASHSVEPDDLARCLQRTGVVDNPSLMAEKVIYGPDEKVEDEEKLVIDVRWTVICDLFLLLIADSIYDARSRTLLVKFAEKLGIERLDLCQFERRITEALELEETSEQVWNEEEILKNRRKLAKRKKYMYVGLATVGGSLVLGLSGGLLAPVIGAGIAAGLTTIGITGTTGFLAGAGGTTIVALGSTAIGARAGAQGMMKRVGDVKTFEFVPLHNNKRANLIITVSGWMNSKSDDVRLPFSTVDPVVGDLYSVLWEPELLQSMGETIGILASEVLTQSIQQILGATILMAFMSAIQLPMMLSKLKYLIDNPWNVSLDRAWKAGLVLADTLIARNLGERPVTLIGFSLGSRVIYSCLLELAKRGAHGLVEEVIMFGSPVVGSNEQLMLARSVVSGRFINGYSKKDWILGYLFRATSGGLRRVAGLSPIQGVDGIENFDCTNLVEGHMGYRTAMPKLISQLGFRVLSEDFVEIDEPDPEATERQRKLIMEFDEARKLMEQEGGFVKKKGFFAKWMKPKKKEWWEMYSESRNSSQETITRRPSVVEEFDVDKVMDQVEKMKLGEYTPPMSPATTIQEEETEDMDKTIELAEESDIKDELMPASQDSEKDDLEEVQEEVQEEVEKPQDTPQTKDYDYDDDNEFPQSERNITMTFG